jgi:NAD(P)-dependent dehydrogenase (short-subunit alcohol dehydrogenase family)
MLPRLDAAIMNAGLSPTSKYEVSADGWERAVQVNVLSTAALSYQLLPQLVKSTKANPGSTPHLTIVGGDSHLQAVFPDRKKSNILGSLNTEASYKGKEFDRYCVSKLFDAYIAVELANLTLKLMEARLRLSTVSCQAFARVDS